MKFAEFWSDTTDVTEAPAGEKPPLPPERT